MRRPGAGTLAAGAVLLVTLVAWRLQQPARAAGVQGTGRVTPDGDAVSAVLAGARGTNPVVCALAARALDDRFGWSGLDSWGGWPPGEGEAGQSRMVDRLMEGVQDGAAIPPLAAGLADADPCVRRLAAPLLGRMRDPRAVAALRGALAGPDPATRAAAAIGLGFTRDAGVGSALVAALGDASSEVRSGAAWALGRREESAAQRGLTALLRRDPDAGVRRMAAWALGRMER
jgi:hypothetical protein